jgi:hypothetical protein
MAEVKYVRLPEAADSEDRLGVEPLYLALKPQPTAQVPVSTQQMHR